MGLARLVCGVPIHGRAMAGAPRAEAWDARRAVAEMERELNDVIGALLTERPAEPAAFIGRRLQAKLKAAA